MKRKVKFQAGGSVDEPSPRRKATTARSRQLRETAEKMEREGRRLQAAERERGRQVAQREDARQSQATRREIAQFNDRVNRAMPITPEQARSLGARPVPPRAATPPATPPAATAAAPVTRSIAGAVGRRVLGPAAALVPTSLEEGAAFERRELPRALEQARSREQAEPSDGPGAGSMRNARPVSRPARRPQRPARRAAREEISADDLNDMVLEQLAGRRSQPRTMPMAQARDNIELAMGRDTQPEIGSVQREDFRRGGMIAAKPKKAAPKKAMPFKKGGAIKMKGKK